MLLVAAAAVSSGCSPKIGDDCKSSVDCSQQGDRLCDTTQPGGYCTIFNCEPGTCPEDDGVCVAFNPELDPACQAVDDGQWARFERTFCMHECEDHDDCRDDYECVGPETRGALIVDTDPLEPKVCMAKVTVQQPTLPEIPQVCFPQEDQPNWTPYEPGSGGAGGEGGAGGGAGDGGAGGGGGPGAGGGGGAGGG